jgi:hypothetical protein
VRRLFPVPAAGFQRTPSPARASGVNRAS